jgi:hypothetical protein
VRRNTAESHNERAQNNQPASQHKNPLANELKPPPAF